MAHAEPPDNGMRDNGTANAHISSRFADYCFQFGLGAELQLSAAAAHWKESASYGTTVNATGASGECSVVTTTPLRARESGLADRVDDTEYGQRSAFQSLLESTKSTGSSTDLTSAILGSLLDASFAGLGQREADGVPAAARNATTTITPSSPLDAIYAPALLSRYPAIDRSQHEPFPAHLELFCFPRYAGIRLFHKSSLAAPLGRAPVGAPPSSKTSAPPAPHFHPFVVTDAKGGKLHAMCVTFYERLPERHRATIAKQLDSWSERTFSASEREYARHINAKLLAEEERLNALIAGADYDQRVEPYENSIGDNITELQDQIAILRSQLKPFERALADIVDDIYVPRVIGIVGRWAFYGVWKDWLWTLVDRHVHQKLHLPVERYIINFLDEIPLPPPGKLQLRITIDSVELICSRPPLNTAPILRTYPLFCLFRCLRVERIIRLLECILDERKVVLVSREPSLLGLVADAILSLIYPFYWAFVYIPVLPLPLLNYLHAPVPFIVGVDPIILNGFEMPDDIVRVDLDADSISLPAAHARPKSMLYTSNVVPFLPSRLRQKLTNRLRKYCSLQTRTTFSPGVPSTVRSTRAALGHLWCGTNVKKRELRELHMVNIRREVRSLRDTVNAELTSARNMHGSTHLAPPVDAAPLHPLNPLVAISSPSTADSRKGFSDVAMIDGKPLPASPDKSLPSRPPTQISIHSMPLMTDAPTSTRIASDDVAVTDISAPITSPTAQEDSTAKEHLPSSPTAVIATTAQTHSSLLQDDGAHSRAFMRRSFNLSKQIVPSSSSIRTRLSQQFVEMIDSTRNRMRGERPAVEPLPSGGTSLGSDDLVAKSFFVHNDELEVDGDERRNESRRSRGDQPLKREFRYFNFWTPSRTRAGRSASIQDTHVHCALADASLAAYALDVEMLGDDICLVTPRDGQLLDHENGHRFHSVVAAINPNIAVKVSGENMPDSLPLGVCICCYGVVRAPLLLKMNITWSGGGYVQEDNEDKRPWWTSDALLCKDCPMLVHRSCSATVLHACPGAMDEGKVQSSFLKLWTALLSDYRMFLCDGTKRTTDMSMARFRTDDFVKHHSNDREMSAFFSRFCATQAFQQFVDDRADKTCTDNEVLFFDELIQAKRNRSVLKLNKDSTPFLEDGAFSIHAEHVCLSPNAEHLELDQESSQASEQMFPEMWVPEIAARKVPRLVTEVDLMRVKVYTTAILRRARMDKQQKKQKQRGWVQPAYMPRFTDSSRRESRAQDLPVNHEPGENGESSIFSVASSTPVSGAPNTVVPAEAETAARLPSRLQQQDTRRSLLNARIEQIYMTLNAIVEHAVSERGLVEFIRFSTSSIVYAPILDELASKSPPTVPAGDSTTATDAITKRSHWERVMEALAVQRKEIEACGLDATQLDDAKSEKDDIYALELLLSDMVAHCREALTQLGARHD